MVRSSCPVLHLVPVMQVCIVPGEAERIDGEVVSPAIAAHAEAVDGMFWAIRHKTPLGSNSGKSRMPHG